jgi:hypothetical protein
MMTVGGYTILKGSVLAIDTSNIVMVVRRSNYFIITTVINTFVVSKVDIPVITALDHYEDDKFYDAVKLHYYT